jgi:maleamate amidohydrolase
MPPRVWDRFLTEDDREHLAQMKPKTPTGFGTKAAVLSLDNYRGAIGDRRVPLLDSIQEWPNSTGLAGWEALDRISELLAAARAAGLPVIHLTGLATEASGVPNWRARSGERGASGSNPAPLDRHRRRYDIVDQAAPLPGEVVLTKSAPSAFFGTPLLPYLIGEGIDTLIVVGETVSGCVRASVVDGCSNRLRMIVVEECVYDRHEATRAMNLFDIDQKYGDVLGFAEVMDWIGSHAVEPAQPSPRKHQHGHVHRHEHTTYQSAQVAGPAGVPDLPLPHVLSQSLPAGAQPVAVSEHPLPGHVVSRAGQEVLEAAENAMKAGFGTASHVVGVLTVDALHPDDDPRYAAALELTNGGAIVVGTAYTLPAQTAAAAAEDDDPQAGGVDPEAGPCPECGSTSARVQARLAPRDVAGLRSGAVLYACDVCGTEWDVAVA